MFARMPNVLAAAFDLTVKGGRVIDPSTSATASPITSIGTWSSAP